ncbi:LysR substrate-binding domain-containing protein [Cognatishimia maritima]|uniref:LysR family transcriptional regulator, glycine cleavage system transcriptional activator n=1 Tax=Cognatishimia maritima TaxID=870908 RepID=A0A1M5Q8Y5_9RHOB|nr:LysR substrate-binding domain-containing protein [Cognatishimia maritima]SHH09933.1 LysR family transcriptional regulator, glycine cleavage system transcriptional activator [Cognatishimia maritima]
MTTYLRHLNALRAFEVAARHESISKAAAELNVSHSVVSQHIKILEAWFDTELFQRTGNRIKLSDDGRSLLPRVSAGLQTLKDACADLLSATQKGTLVISAEPALASLWLRRYVAEFCDEFPNIDVDLRPAWLPPQLGEDHADLIIHFETRLPMKGVRKQRIFPIEGYPACSPELAASLPKVDGKIDWNAAPLVHDNGREIWQKWYSAHQPGSQAWEEGRVYSDLSLAIHAAADGDGIILADDILCAQTIQKGTLVAVDDRRVHCVWYALASPKSDKRKPAADTFTEWLLNRISRLEV